MNQLTTTPTIYKPVFNPDTGKYIDICPYDSGQRNRHPHKCQCNGLIFMKRAQFFSHILSKTHVKYTEEYDLNTKEVEDLKTENNILLAEKLLAERKLSNKTFEFVKAVKAIKHLQGENINLMEFIKKMDTLNEKNSTDLDLLKTKYDIKLEEVNKLEIIIKKYEEYEYDAEDFQDCLE